jgi:F0F1-type ATP synthase epsilon subunit
VLPDKVTVLAQIAERAEDIDQERAEKAMARAEGRVKVPGAPDIDFERAAHRDDEVADAAPGSVARPNSGVTG